MKLLRRSTLRSPRGEEGGRQGFSPKYLHGACGRVIDLDEHTATVCLPRPVCRFKSGHVRCPPLALDRLQPQAAAPRSPTALTLSSMT